MFTVEVETTIEAAHRIDGMAGAEASLHGHSWRVTAVFEKETLDNMGTVAHPRDIQRIVNSVVGDLSHRVLNDVVPFDEVNPTPETIARFIFEGLDLILREVHAPDSLRVREVHVSIPSYSASYSFSKCLDNGSTG